MTAKQAKQITAKAKMSNKQNKELEPLFAKIERNAKRGYNYVHLDEEFDLNLFALVSNNERELVKLGYKITWTDGIFGYATVQIEW